MDLKRLLSLKESEHKVEFKAATKNFKYSGGDSRDPKDRRHCVLGYVIAFCNEGGGMLVLGVHDDVPHKVVGSDFAEGKEGALEDKIYNDIGIRVSTEVLYENDKRVLVIHVPSRPVGKLMRYESVPLMRVGESLREMSDAEMLKILSEQEPDFSATICPGLSFQDLDVAAINVMAEKYAEKQGNKQFLSLSSEQQLSDLDLSRNGHLTYAALILVGKREALEKFLPQSALNIEYRVDPATIHFNDRLLTIDPFFLNIEVIWDYISLRNGTIPIQQGAYMTDVPFLNEEVVRESVINAIVHRSYQFQSEVVIKQSNSNLDIISPGPFPLGVSQENIITVNSTPRNRLMADILLKTGIVERSGQGVDKLFKNTIQEAKGTPDYSRSDNFQVYLHIPTVVQDNAFVLFIEHIQRELKINLSLMEVITLENIRQQKDKSIFDPVAVKSLLDKHLIEPVGRTVAKGYMLSKVYYAFTNQPAAYTKQKDPHINNIWLQVQKHLSGFAQAKMSDFESLFNAVLTREQVKSYIYMFTKLDILSRKGSHRGTYYELSASIAGNQNQFQAGLDILNNM